MTSTQKRRTKIVRVGEAKKGEKENKLDPARGKIFEPERRGKPKRKIKCNEREREREREREGAKERKIDPARGRKPKGIILHAKCGM